MKKTKGLPNFKKIVYDFRWSPEIEVEFPKRIDIEKLYTRYRSFLGGWKVTHDTSLDNGLEFKPANSHILKFDTESFEEIREILHLVKGHKGDVSKKCGLHIHIDASKLSDKQVLAIVKEFIHRQKYIINNFKVHHSRLESMCKVLPKDGLSKIKPNHIRLIRDKKGWSLTPYPYFKDKHFALNILNLEHFNTLEFRLFNATMNVKEIKDIVKWLFDFIISCLERD